MYRALRERMVVSLGVGAVAVLVGLGCGSFGSADDGAADAGTAEGAAADAGVTEAANGDAPDQPAEEVVGATPGGRACASPICEDFESLTWRRDWTPKGTAFDVTLGRATSGKRALDVALTADGPAYLLRSFGAARKVAVTVNVLVLQQGGGEVDLLGITDGLAQNGKGVYLTRAGAGGFEIETSGTKYSDLAQTFPKFTQVRLEVDLDQQTFSYAIGDEVKLGQKLPTTISTSTLYVVVGAPFTSGVTAAWHMRFDDLEVVTTP